MTTKQMPDWLRQLLIEQGHLTNDGASRKAHASYCRECGAHIVIGLDHERAALVARCDPQPLNSAGEYAALMAGLATFSLSWRYSHYELDWRSPEAIQAKPAHKRTNHFDVLAQHHCNNAATNPQDFVPSRIPPPPSPPEADQCPF